jgi:FAD/FMN-containing dehydrogenase
MRGNAAVDSLRNRIRGALIGRDDPGYDTARRIWNRLVERKPRWIVRCAGPIDVVAAVRFAREQGLEIAVKGGGHHAAGHALIDDGLVIDVSAMKGLTLDVEKRRAVAQTGLTWKEFDCETQAWQLATTGPIVSMTGLPGFTLGGGIGWLHRSFGLGCDNLVSADVVTADGAMLRTDESRNPDLLWALRGGGGNFGVATALEFRLHPMGPDVVAGLLYFPITDLARILTAIQEWVERAPDELMVCLFLRRAPAVPIIPDRYHATPVVAVALCWSGRPDAGEPWLQSARRLGTLLADTIRLTPYIEWQRSLDARWGEGLYNDWTGHFIDDAQRCSDVLATAIEALRSPWSDIKMFMLGGAVARVSPDATAFGCRKSRFALVIQARWDDPALSSAELQWARSTLAALVSCSNGSVYANFLAADEALRVPTAFGDQNYRRLREIKRHYDPSNVFHCNANIVPAPLS